MDFDWHNPESSSKLSRAVKARNIADVKRLLKQGKSSDEPDNRGYTALHEASRADDLLDIVKVLVNSGAYIEHKTVEGETPLFLACVYSSEKIVQYFLSHNCLVNNSNIDSVSPLHIACSKRNYNVIDMLIKAGANVDAKDNEMLTPIFYAIQFENLGAVKMLLLAGCNAETMDYFSRTPLQYSCTVGNVEIFDVLVEHLGLSKELVNRQTSDGWTLLMEAVQFKNYSIAEKLISYGADTSLVDSRGMLALHLAAHCSRTDCLELIIRHTPKDVIERHATGKEDLTHTRSLPCLLIDKDMFDGLKLLLEYGVSDEVLSCPARMGDCLVSPVSFLLLHANKIDPQEKMKYLELLLSKDALKDPIYWNPPLIGIRSADAAVRSHKMDHVDCICEQLLAMVLNEGVNPDVPKLNSLPFSGLSAPFIHAIDTCFIKGLSLLLVHSTLTEPEEVLDHVLKKFEYLQRHVTKNEEDLVKFLVWASTDTRNSLRKVSQLSKAPGDLRFLSLSESIKAKTLSIPSLRSLSRQSIRSHVRQYCDSSDPTHFRHTLKSLCLPRILTEYLLYEHFLSYPAPD